AALLKTNSFVIQTRGYSRGSCRRLEHIRDTLCKAILENASDSESRRRLWSATRRLRVACSEVMRAIAREVGEDAKAYRRHRQFGIFLAGDEWTPKREKECQKKTYSISKELHRALFEDSSSLHRQDALREAAGRDEGNAGCEWLRW